MAMRPTCDVFGTPKGVKRYEVIINAIAQADDLEIVTPEIEAWRGDLCPRALERLKNKIKTGTTPPAERKNHKPKENNE